MTAQLIEAITSGMPGISITISAQDLKEVVNGMVHNERRRIKEETERNKERYIIPREEAARLLNVSLATLSRWAKSGYLVPQKLGVKVFYRQSDIENINNI